MNKKAVLARRISQFFFFFFFVFVLWSTTYPLTGPVKADVLFQLDPLLIFAASLSQRSVLAGFAFSVIMVILAFVMGRFFCGWVCPLGAVIDFVSAQKKVRVLSDARNRRLRKIKYVILAFIVAGAAAGFQAAWVLDPIVIAARFVSLNLIPAVTFAVDYAFAGLISGFQLYGFFYDLYRSLKQSLLGVGVRFVANSAVIFASFLVIVIMADLLKRSWCRIFCPLGCLYAIAARAPVLKRKVRNCTHCGACAVSCRMGAIKENGDYNPSECVLCMDCVYSCPGNKTRFGFPDGSGSVRTGAEPGISRRQFLTLGVLSFVAAGFARGEPLRKVRKVIRPPGAVREDDFLDRCVRCGNCMKVCVTNGLQPAFLQAGLEGIWTPHLVPEIGYCEYKCTLCGSVCPTGAIPRLAETQKKGTRLGIAKIDRSLCLPWKKKQECLVCEEHCPVADKAIQLREVRIDGKVLLRPYIHQDRCIGCGICQTKCPVRPNRAIIVYPVKVTHSSGIRTGGE